MIAEAPPIPRRQNDAPWRSQKCSSAVARALWTSRPTRAASSRPSAHVLEKRPPPAADPVACIPPTPLDKRRAASVPSNPATNNQAETHDDHSTVAFLQAAVIRGDTEFALRRPPTRLPAGPLGWRLARSIQASSDTTSTAEAAGRAMAAVAVTARTAGAPLTEDYTETIALLGARLGPVAAAVRVPAPSP